MKTTEYRLQLKWKDEELYSKVGETVLVILDKIEREGKASLLSKLFKAYIDEKIKREDFLRLRGCLKFRKIKTGVGLTYGCTNTFSRCIPPI